MINSIIILVSTFVFSGASVGNGTAGFLAGQDIYLDGQSMTFCQKAEGGYDHSLVFNDQFSLTIGDCRLASQSAVIWLRQVGEYGRQQGAYYEATAYLEKDVMIEKGPQSRTTSMQSQCVSRGEAVLVHFLITGEVFATAQKRKAATAEELTYLDVYNRALGVRQSIRRGPAIAETAKVPELIGAAITEAAGVEQEIPPTDTTQAETETPVMEPVELAPPQLELGGRVRAFPVHISAMWEPAPQIERHVVADGPDIVTVSGRFYLRQGRPSGELMEFMADRAVVYYKTGQFDIEKNKANGAQLASGQVSGVYFQGHIVMTEGERVTRAEELFYDFENHQALVLNAVMRTYDETRKVPVYVRAKTLKRISETFFEAEDVQLTNSEFYFPQFSANASRMVMITDKEVIDNRQQRAEQADEESKQQRAFFTMHDVSFNYYDISLFHLDKLNTDGSRPDWPITRFEMGYDSDYGPMISTMWDLDKILGWDHSPNTSNRLLLDYFGERGLGAGWENEYRGEDYYGKLISYVLDDHGTDDLGQTANRRDLEPEAETRGRFSWRHRMQLPDDWIATFEFSYLSDRNFLEWMYRDEFHNDKGQENIVHLKKIKDTWAFSILGKFRVNDFITTTEEMPTIEYHQKGVSFWDHRLTWYSDTQLSRLRDRYDDDLNISGGNFYTFFTTRQEVDLPLRWDRFKIVPYVAGTYGYEDKNLFTQTLDSTTVASGLAEKEAFLGEAGLRMSTMFWKENQYIRSRFWDINGIRHIIRPHLEVIKYNADEEVFDMRDTVNVGLSQRWQTRRGPAEELRSLDWIRLDVDATWVSNDMEDSIGNQGTYGPAKYIYNDPSIPVMLRRGSDYYGIVRDSVNADFEMRISDTFSMLSDINVDMDAGKVQQLDVGMRRFVYPDISWYLGSRYLRPVFVQVDEDNDSVLDVTEEGSHSVVAAVTYALSERYTAGLYHEYNFDFGKPVRTDLTLIRTYHRMNFGLTLSVDETRDRQTIRFTLWPHGVEELGIGDRKYMGLTGSYYEE